MLFNVPGAQSLNNSVLKCHNSSNLAHRRAQCLDLVDEQATLTFQQINYEAIRSSRNAIAAAVGDGRILPEPMSAYGGMALGHPGRCAFPYMDSSRFASKLFC